MEPTYVALYCGFELRCSPQRVGDHAFVPRLVIHDSYESLSLEIPMGAPETPFEDPTEAARQAFEHGRRWVDSGFDASTMVEEVDTAMPPDDPLLLPR